MANSKRMNFRFSESTVATLEEIANERGITLTEAIRQAIETEAYLRKIKKSGAKILIQEGESIKEIIFR